ncbi:MAG: UPF0280 family protein [Deltaproteobacteria bacterium]
MWDRQILSLGDGSVLVECGPMRMFIEASAAGTPRPDLCRRAAEKAVTFLEEVAAQRNSLRAPALEVPEPTPRSIVHRMWEAARLVGDADLTPMASVAGAIADATADLLEREGMSRVVVNNGGDVAFRLKDRERLYVGIRPDVGNSAMSHRVLVTPDMGLGGVTTSGLGGRSFTRGVASAATVFASTATTADAAATAVANATYVPSENVIQRMAESIQPDTDLKGVRITASLGDLSPEEIEKALQQGMTKAEEMASRGLIYGACLFVKGRMRSTSRLSPLLEPLVPISRY